MLSRSFYSLRFWTGEIQVVNRRIPVEWDSAMRAEFVAVAQRSQDEACALFTFAALGLVRYYRSSKLGDER